MNNIFTYNGSVVYKATNLVNNKCYVGKSINFRNRYQKHKSAKYYTTAFHNAIRKYGFANFKFEILEYCEPKDLIIRENYWILYFDSINPEKGYNLRLDSKDNSGWKHSDASKLLISISGKGRKPWHAGKKVGNLKSTEGIAKFVKQMTGAGNPNAKRVYQFDLNNNFLAEFDCVSTAARKLNIVFQGIARCASGERKSYKGFKWSYNKPDFAVMQKSYLFNCWELLTDNAEDNQQRSLSNKERSTTIAEMRVGTSVPKQETWYFK